jgi:hypothetical protein
MSFTSKDLNPLVRGDDWTIKLSVQQNGSVVDITGYTYYFTLKADIDAVDPGDLQVTASSVGADAAAGIVYINVSDTQTNSLEARNYNYDVQQIDDSGNIQTLLLGKVKVVKDVTRTTS